MLLIKIIPFEYDSRAIEAYITLDGQYTIINNTFLITMPIYAKAAAACLVFTSSALIAKKQLINPINAAL
jgi:hypothetical protein